VFSSMHTLNFAPMYGSPIGYLSGAARNVFWSSLFLSWYTSGIKASTCLFRSNLHRNSDAMVYMGGLLTGIGVTFEHPKRQVELGLCKCSAYLILSEPV